MKWETRNVDGTKSLDCKIKRLVNYVNNHVAHMDTEESKRWAQKTIENGVRNLAENVFAQRID